MTRREFQWSRNFFILSGALFMGLGISTPFRTEPETLWQVMWMIVSTIMQIILAIMQFGLAQVLYKRAQTAKE
jgi:hypothetical protein